MGLKSPVAKNFRRDMQNLTTRLQQGFHENLLAQADELIENMRGAIDHSVSGHLSASVRKRDVSKLDAYGTGKLSVLVMAGGPLTTRRTKAGAAYDYALAEEFGTVNEQARPFFYSSARFYQQHDIDWARETVEQAIAENNRTRAGLNSDNYQFGGTFGHTVLISHSGPGGAVKIQNYKGKQYT